eukprot:7357700-Pyramimonas_sp.AAC.1
MFELRISTEGVQGVPSPRHGGGPAALTVAFWCDVSGDMRLTMFLGRPRICGSAHYGVLARFGLQARIAIMFWRPGIFQQC